MILVSNSQKPILEVAVWLFADRSSETYEAVIARLLKSAKQDDLLSPAIIKNVGVADIKAGCVYTSEQVKKKLGLKGYFMVGFIF